MTLCELVSSKYSDVPLIGLYEEGQEKIIPDFTDEVLETEVEKEVLEHHYSKKNNVLVVTLKKDEY